MHNTNTPKHVLLDNAHIFDTEGGCFVRAAVGIEAEKIVFVETHAPQEWEGAERIDLSGYFLIPGLIDCHVHLVSPLSQSTHEPYWKLTTPPATKALTAMANAARSLAAGFTTIRNCGGTTWNCPEDIAVRNAVADGSMIGSRVFASAGGISMTGGHGDRGYPANLPYDPNVCGGGVPADGADACRAAVRGRIKLGADFIKIYTTGGVSTVGDGPHSQDFTEQELQAIVEEAHMHNKRVATHAQGLAGIRKAVLSGVDTVEHASFLDHSTAEEMAKRKTSLVTTLCVFGEIVKRADRYPNQEAIVKAKLLLEAQRNALGVAREAGINIAMGTDASQSIMNGDNAKEMLALYEYGFSSAEVLRMATQNAAAALGLENEIGRIAPNMRADLLVLEKNAVEDLPALADKTNIRGVMQAGAFRVLRTAAGDESLSRHFLTETVSHVLTRR